MVVEAFMISGYPIIEKYFSVTPHQKSLLESLGNLYHEWNTRLNLVSRQDLPHLYVRHVLHSLSIAKMVQFLPESKILDVGTGGGFPTIPLAIMFPDVQFLAIDSIGKKVRAVQGMIDALSLPNVTTEQIRAEKVRGNFDFVLGRAVTRLPTFISWVKDRVSPVSRHEIPNGVLYLKGGDFDQEVSAINLPYKIYPIQSYFEDPFFETKKVVHIMFNQLKAPR